MVGLGYPFIQYTDSGVVRLSYMVYNPHPILIITLSQTKSKDVNEMKTVSEIIEYLGQELAEAYEMHDAAKGKDAAQALAYMLKAATIQHLLDEITQSE